MPPDGPGDRDVDGKFFGQTFDDAGYLEIDEPLPDLNPAVQRHRRVDTAFDVYIVAGVGRLIRVAAAGLISLALAIGLLLCLLFWRDRR